MIYDTSNEYQRQEFLEKVKWFTDNHRLVEMKERKPQRTIKQNSYLHLLIGYFACMTGYSTDEVKLDIYKRTCNKDLYTEKFVNRQGKECERLRHSYELDKGEMALSITRFRNYSASVAGIYLPSADDHDFQIHCMQEIERNKEFVNVSSFD